MATNLPSAPNPLELGEIGASLVRVARLDADCSPSQGTNGGIVTVGLSTMTVDPEVEEGTAYEPKNAAGTTFYSYVLPDRVKRYNISGEFLAMDPEMAELLFGGSTIIGDGTSISPTDVIGYAAPAYTDTPNNGVYLEVVRQQIARGAGDCTSIEGTFAPYVGYIFGKARLRPGSQTFEDAPGTFSFAGTSTNNPNLYDGPWNDWPGTGYVPNSPYIKIGYTQAQFDAMLAEAGAGYVDLGVAS